MPTYPDPACLTLARTIRDLLEDSGLTVVEQHTAVEIARTLIRYSRAPLTPGDPDLHYPQAPTAAAAHLEALDGGDKQPVP